MKKAEFKKKHTGHKTKKIKEKVFGKMMTTHIYCVPCKEAYSKGLDKPLDK